MRLVGGGREEVWESASAADDPILVRSQAADAAAWVAERTGRSQGAAGPVGLLCLDVEGASCEWLTAPSSDPAVVAAVLAQGGAYGSAEGAAPSAGGPWAPASPSESSVQALAVATPKPQTRGLSLKKVKAPAVAATAGERLAVLAVPDVLGRLFVDALDEKGVLVERAVSLWHAMALGWDPASPVVAGGAGATIKGEVVVAQSAPITAVVLIDPAGRLVWSWSRQGELAAAGTIRLPVDGQSIRVGGSEIARLTADWLSWSVQLGKTPNRVICIGPELDGVGDESLSPAQLGSALGNRWSGATVDLAVHDDPIGATLRRLVPLAEGSGGDVETALTALVDLSRRPGRLHRSMYRWVSAAVLALAVALLAIGWRAWGTASKAREARKEAKAVAVERATKVAPPGTSAVAVATAESQPRAYMEDQLRKKRQSLNPTAGLDQAPPILAELETLSYVLGTKDIQIDQLSLLSGSAIINIFVPNTVTGEEIKQGLDTVGDSRVEWGPLQWGGGRTSKPNMQPVAIYGKWRTTPAPAGPGNAAAGGHS